MFAMRARTDAQVEARRLRAQGLTLRQIATRVDASLSSVSVWVRSVRPDVPAAVEATDLTKAAPAQGSKTCRKCRAEKPLSAFSKERDGHQKWCKACWREYTQRHRESKRAAADARRARARNVVKAIKASGACTGCGLADPDCLEFDHIGEKTGNIGALVASRIGVERLKAELDRCELVCACCHRRRTARRRPPRQETRFDRGRHRNLRLAHRWASLLGCADCGEDDPDVLDFDHVGEKRANIGTMTAHGVRIGVLFEEMLQCEIRCANCHRRRHAREDTAAAA